MNVIVEAKRDIYALELKASRHVAPGDRRGLRAFADGHGKRSHPLVLYLEEDPRRLQGIDVLPWQHGLRAIGL